MNIKQFLNGMGIAMIVFFLSCERVPHNAITDARTALELAEKSGARAWAPSPLKRGHIFLDSAMNELSREKKKLPFNRNYKKVIELLDLAYEAGMYALESKQAVNLNMMSGSQELLYRAKELTDSVDRVLKTATANKKNVRHLQAALDSAKTAQKEAIAMLDSGDMLLAEENAMIACDKAEEVARNTTRLLTPQKKGAGK